MNVSGDDPDGHSLSRRYSDGTFVRIAIRRTDSEPYPCGWRYAPHYGAVDPDAVDDATLADGTIRRYDNAHEKTKGHELHVAPDPDPESIEFPGMAELYERFWDDIPKPAVELSHNR
jgi:hypothetical protein